MKYIIFFLLFCASLNAQTVKLKCYIGENRVGVSLPSGTIGEVSEGVLITRGTTTQYLRAPLQVYEISGNRLRITDANNILTTVSASETGLSIAALRGFFGACKCNSKLYQGTGAPSGAPSPYQQGMYIDTTASTIYVYGSGTWTAIGGGGGGSYTGGYGIDIVGTVISADTSQLVTPYDLSLVDQSATNEIQVIDTFAVVDDSLRLSLSLDGTKYKAVSLSDYNANFFNADLTATGDRAHDGAGYGVSWNNSTYLEIVTDDFTYLQSGGGQILELDGLGDVSRLNGGSNVEISATQTITHFAPNTSLRASAVAPHQLQFEMLTSAAHILAASPTSTVPDTTYLPDVTCPVDGYVLKGRTNSTTYWAADSTGGGGGGLTFADTLTTIATISDVGQIRVRVDTFLADATYTVPTGARSLEILCFGGGGGGGSGRRGATANARFGGGGGASGAYSFGTFLVSSLGNPTTLTVSTGNTGTGGAARTVDNSNGLAGSNGDTSYVKVGSTYVLFAFGGTAGSFGNSANGTGGVASTRGMIVGVNGASSSATAIPSGSSQNNNISSGSGGAGAGISTADLTFTGGGAGFACFANIAGGTGGATSGASGANGSAGIYFGSGGGGGASSLVAAGGNGGNGAGYGSGGGGGAASANGFNSGAGGNGGRGAVIIIAHF